MGSALCTVTNHRRRCIYIESADYEMICTHEKKEARLVVRFSWLYFSRHDIGFSAFYMVEIVQQNLMKINSNLI